MKSVLKSPVSSSTPTGPAVALQPAASSVPRERSLRRKREKQDDDQLIIVRLCVSSSVYVFISILLSKYGGQYMLTLHVGKSLFVTYRYIEMLHMSPECSKLGQNPWHTATFHIKTAT